MGNIEICEFRLAGQRKPPILYILYWRYCWRYCYNQPAIHQMLIMHGMTNVRLALKTQLVQRNNLSIAISHNNLLSAQPLLVTQVYVKPEIVKTSQLKLLTIILYFIPHYGAINWSWSPSKNRRKVHGRPSSSTKQFKSSDFFLSLQLAQVGSSVYV